MLPKRLRMGIQSQYRHLKRCLSYILIAALILPVVFSLPASTTRVNAQTAADANEIIQVSDTQRLYLYDNYTVDYSYSPLWDGSLSVSMTITNTGSEAIENWAMCYDFGGDVRNPWGGALAVTGGGCEYLNNGGYNANIAPGGSVLLGYTVENPRGNFPEGFAFIQERVEQTSDGYTAELRITSSWDNNINGMITITNVTDTPVRNWEFSFASNFSIDQSWVADIQVIEVPAGYKLKGIGSADIEAGASVSLSFAGTVSDSSIAPELSEAILTGVAAVDSNDNGDNGDNSGSISIEPWPDDGGDYTFIDPFEGHDIVIDDQTAAAITDNTVIELQNLNAYLAYPLEIYENEDHTQIIGINGKFSEVIVKDPTDALYSLYSVKTLLGLSDPKNQLVLSTVNFADEFISYQFQQVIDGIPVSGRVISLVADAEGETLSLSTNILPDAPNMEMKAGLSFEAVRDMLLVQLGTDIEVRNEGLTVYSLEAYESTPVLTYQVVVSGYAADGEYISKLLYVNADPEEGRLSPDIVEEYSNIMNSVGYHITGSGKNEQGQDVSFPVYVPDPIITYSMEYRLDLGKPVPVEESGDLQKDISVYKDGLFKSKYRNLNNKWNDPTAVSAYTNVLTVLNWFKKEFKRNSYDNKGTGFDIYVHESSKGRLSNAYWDTNDNAMHFSDNDIKGMTVTQAGALDTVAHEFTHGVVYSCVGGYDKFPNENATGAINEGYADVFAYLIDPGNWLVGEAYVEMRDLAHPELSGTKIPREMWQGDSSPQKQQPRELGGQYYYDYKPDGNDSDFGGVHTNSSLVTYPMYLMVTDSENPFTNTKIGELFYKSLLLNGYNASSDFLSVRRNLIGAARALAYSDADIQTIQRAFDAVNIMEEVGSVEVTILNGGSYADNAVVSLNQYGREIVKGTSSGQVRFDGLAIGTYTLKVEPEGCSPIHSQVLVREGETTNKVVTILTSGDSFAWTEYDHYNRTDIYVPALPKHILYEGDHIRMVGYSAEALKDFLIVEDSHTMQTVFDQKILSFDIQRDSADWHSMEGGGFLFNASVREDNMLRGFCILVTHQGLKLYQISGVDVDSFRDGKTISMAAIGKLLGTYNIGDVLAEHAIRLSISGPNISVWDGDNLVIDNMRLPDNNYGYGFGPITSHLVHSCSQVSYFTFRNITMQTITG